MVTLTYCKVIRKQADPIILYSEFGYGRLEMYVLGPVESALNDYRKKWPKGEKIDMGVASGAVLLIFRPINRDAIRILIPGAADTNLLLAGFEKLRERIKDRSLLTCLLSKHAPQYAAEAMQAPKPRSQSAFRNVRSKVDTSQPKSFAPRSTSLQRKKTDKDVKKATIVPISISPKDKKTSPSNAKPATKTKKRKEDFKRSKPSSFEGQKEPKMRVRPSSIPLMSTNKDNSQSCSEVENKRDAVQKSHMDDALAPKKSTKKVSKTGKTSKVKSTKTEKKVEEPKPKAEVEPVIESRNDDQIIDIGPKAPMVSLSMVLALNPLNNFSFHYSLVSMPRMFRP